MYNFFSQTIDLKIFQSCLWWKKSQVKNDKWTRCVFVIYPLILRFGPALVCCSLVSWVIIFSLIFSSGKIIILRYHLKDLGLSVDSKPLFANINAWLTICRSIFSGSRFSGRCDEQCWDVLFGRLWCHWLRSGSHIGKIQAGWFNECTASFVFSLLTFIKIRENPHARKLFSISTFNFERKRFKIFCETFC